MVYRFRGLAALDAEKSYIKVLRAEDGSPQTATDSNLIFASFSGSPQNNRADPNAVSADTLNTHSKAG